jgi:toxin ParE1/3/4
VSYRLLVRPEVNTDLLEAEAWYESRQPGLGREFLQAVRTKLIPLARNPLLYRLRHRRSGVRWTYPCRFPHRIVFRVVADTVIVYAVIHAARHDREWKKRV